MPKLVSELAQGKSYSRSSEGGALADTATRVWKVLLEYPNEPFVVPEAVGVNIGDPLSESELIPCVSLDVKADGESRLVRIVTATYRTTPGVGLDVGGGESGGERDPKLDPPDIRPAMFSISGSLEEIAVHEYYDTPDDNSSKAVAKNPNGELYDGLTTLVPSFTINIEQFDTLPTRHNDKIGYINSQSFTFSGSSVPSKACMLRNIETVPVVETWGGATFRGFKRTFQFMVTGKPNGWNLKVPVTGYMVLQAGLGSPGVNSDALALERSGGRVLTTLPTPTGRDYAAATQGTRVRAMVKIPFDDGGYTQVPSGQPVPLFSNGTPLDATVSSIEFEAFRTQPEMPFGDDFSAFDIRWIF
jgi:hypothetical protein